MTEIYFVCL